MRILFKMDRGNPGSGCREIRRDSVRAILIRGSRIALVYSRKYDYYKFPGGGIEPGESHMQTLLRETREEAGLQVKEKTVIPFGMVPRKETDGDGGLFLQDNFYYFCQAEERPVSQQLDAYEAEEGYILRYADPEEAIRVNRFHSHGDVNQNMLERDAAVLELLLKEGYLK